MASEFSYNFAAGRSLARETSPPRSAQKPDFYPFDLDGSERYTRPATGWTLWPSVATYPNNLGQKAVSGILRQFDVAVWSQMVAKLPAGPTIAHVPTDPTQYGFMQAVFPMTPQVGYLDRSGYPAADLVGVM